MDPLELNKDAEIEQNDLTQENKPITSPENGDATLNQPAEVTQPESVTAVELETPAEPEVVVEPETPAEPEVVVEQGAVAVATPAPVEKEVKVQEPVHEKPAVDLNAMSREELIAYLENLLAKEIEEIKDEVEQIKQLFFKKLKAENESNKKIFIENGGEEIDYKPEKDGLDEALKALLNDYKARKAAFIAKSDADKEQNLLQKQHILERMKVLVESNDDVSSNINEFRELQKKWKSTGQVPQQHVNELWKTYSAYQEAFWDLIKINNELREYDFKKNLELKTAICEVAERLGEEEDVVHAIAAHHEDIEPSGVLDVLIQAATVAAA